jgi:hypothetical protein
MDPQAKKTRLEMVRCIFRNALGKAKYIPMQSGKKRNKNTGELNSISTNIRWLHYPARCPNGD